MPDGEPACRFSLPIPPSTNHLFSSVAGRNGNAAARRAKTALYKRWLVDAGWELKAQHAIPAEPIGGRLRVLIEAPLHDRRDLDNALKPLLDLIGCGKNGMRIIVDDSLIDDLRIIRATIGERVTVSIWVI
jgi:Holliday junction resolvase RusA-like endonuclease